MLLGSMPTSAMAAQSPFTPVRVESCVLADSLLGPIAGDRRAVVRRYYLASMDSTRFVAGPERHYMPTEQRRPMIDVMTSYGGHKPTTYPHTDLTVLMIGRDAATLASSAGAAAVVLTIDESSFQLDSVAVKPSPSPVGTTVFTSLQLAPNLFLGLARATQATFLVGTVRVALSPHELQDIRGMYRLALCGLPDAS